MFTEIDIERARDKLSIKGLSEKTGMCYYTLLAKLKGESEFTRSEMLKIQNAFSRKVPLEILFQSDNDELPPQAS